MIESHYWKTDLLDYARRFSPVPNPPRWSEKLLVNFEKDVIIAFFMIRKIAESGKISSNTKGHKARIFRCPCVRKVAAKNFTSIEQIYDLNTEEEVSKGINFLCNQLIHGGAIFAYRQNDRNWGGIYTCSDFERQKYIYRITVSEIITILQITGNDYPDWIRMTYDADKDDYTVETN